MVLQCFAGCCRVLQVRVESWAPVCCCVLQGVARVLQGVAGCCWVWFDVYRMCVCACVCAYVHVCLSLCMSMHV